MTSVSYTHLDVYKRQVYKGHLFVGDLLLSDSPMRHHPLTPMTDANLVRVLQAQAAQSRVGLIERRHVAAGAAAVAERMGVLRREGVRLAIADALDDADLHVLAQACLLYTSRASNATPRHGERSCWH